MAKRENVIAYKNGRGNFSVSPPIRYICPQNKFVYFKNPKAACSSILKIFADNGLLSDPTDLHAPQKIESEGFMDTCRYIQYFKFSFVRNPFSRFVSLFKDKTKRISRGSNWDIPFYSDMSEYSFDEFAIYMSKRKHHLFDRHSQPQFVNLSRLNGLFPKGDSNFIGKIENFNEDINFVANKLGLDIKEIPMKNKSTYEKHYTEYYSNNSRKIVSELYAKDLSFFDYKFGE